MAPCLRILIDDREKQPLSFSCQTIRKRLVHGDYSLMGYEDRIAIERKSLPDLVRCLGSDRREQFETVVRFAKSTLKYYALVIECNYEDMFIPSKWFSHIQPQCVPSFIMWSVKHDLPIFFAGSPEQASDVVYRLLKAATYYFTTES